MTIKEHVINAVAAAATLAVGGTVLGVKINDAKQDQRIERIENLDQSINGLRTDLQRVDVKLSRVEGRMDERDRDARK